MDLGRREEIFMGLMKNKFLRNIYYKWLPFAIQAYISKLIFKPKFGKDMIISRGTKFYYGDVSFGTGTRIATDSVFSNITVGNYTVFAQNFRVLAFVHEYRAFTINNAIDSILGISDKNVNIEKGGIRPHIENYPQTFIGNDVWIGEFVTIKGGVHIGDGAIVAAGSIVTHDVPPFAIVAGVPAKFVKWRFEQEKIELMQDLQWWNWSQDKLRANYTRLCNFDNSLREEILPRK